MVNTKKQEVKSLETFDAFSPECMQRFFNSEQMALLHKYHRKRQEMQDLDSLHYGGFIL